MCGITGIAALPGARPPTEEQLHRMCETLVHRGPDDLGMVSEGGVCLGVRRLAVIDLDTGRQPIANEDGSVVTTLNGEIYNFRELRSDLEKRGHSFSTRTDTEVIVHCYEEFGLDFPNHLNGMFAIAVHDRARGKLILARDHLGIKPLYYHTGRSYLVWGSEIKALLASGLVPRNLDLDALGQFMAWEYVPGPRTLLDGVRKLQPGEILELDLPGGQVSFRSYWKIPVDSPEVSLPEGEWEEAVDVAISEAVQRQLVSDVPLGAFLSGGVDSSLVAAAMDGPSTFSIGFGDKTYNELEFARTVAGHLRTNHSFELIDADAVGLFERLVEMFDDPIGDFSIFPTYLLSRMARRHVTVALSGDGGDELFGGYESYVAQELSRIYDRLPSWVRHDILEPGVGSLRPRPAKKGLLNKARRFIEGVRQDAGLGHARWRLFTGAEMREKLFTGAAQEAMPTAVEAHIFKLLLDTGALDPVNRALYVDTRSYLPDNILAKVDRTSMAVSLEARVPLLDKELVAMAFRIPGDLKVARGRSKVLLKRVAARHVPRHCVYRPKEGFSIPMKTWLLTSFRPLLEDLLSRSRIEADGLFEWQTVQRLIGEHKSGAANHSHVLWSMIVFQAWQDRWLSVGTPVGNGGTGP